MYIDHARIIDFCMFDTVSNDLDCCKLETEFTRKTSICTVALHPAPVSTSQSSCFAKNEVLRLNHIGKICISVFGLFIDLTLTVQR